MTTWTDETKNNASWSDQARVVASEAFLLSIDGTYQLLIGGTHNLEIQEANDGTSWTDLIKS